MHKRISRTIVALVVFAVALLARYPAFAQQADASLVETPYGPPPRVLTNSLAQSGEGWTQFLVYRKLAEIEACIQAILSLGAFPSDLNGDRVIDSADLSWAEARRKAEDQ